MKKNLFLFLLLSFASQAQESPIERLKKHIEYLASDELAGRGAGTDGEKKAALYLVQYYEKLGLTPLAAHPDYFQTFTAKKGLHPFETTVSTQNVMAFLDNQATNTVVIGAHYDHLGTDGQGASLAGKAINSIHNGADDNASGTAGVLELAHYLTKNDIKEKYNYLFVHFAAEELGLVGSKQFTQNPPIPLSSIHYMFNMDMIGRYTADKGLTVGGVGTSPYWGYAVPESIKKTSLRIQVDSTGMGPSDHASFYLQNIPVLSFFTGVHADYHKPSDDADKINYVGQEQVLGFIKEIISRMEKVDKAPFTATAVPQMMSAQSSFKVTMGVIPDYSYAKKGLRLDGVTEGRPAAKAGIKTNDVLIQLGDKTIADIQDYMEALGQFEKGQTVKAIVLRNGKPVELSVTF